MHHRHHRQLKNQIPFTCFISIFSAVTHVLYKAVEYIIPALHLTNLQGPICINSLSVLQALQCQHHENSFIQKTQPRSKISKTSTNTAKSFLDLMEKWMAMKL